MYLTLYDVYLVDGCLWLILFHFNIKLLIFWVLNRPTLQLNSQGNFYVLENFGSDVSGQRTETPS